MSWWWAMKPTPTADYGPQLSEKRVGRCLAVDRVCSNLGGKLISLLAAAATASMQNKCRGEVQCQKCLAS